MSAATHEALENAIAAHMAAVWAEGEDVDRPSGQVATVAWVVMAAGKSLVDEATDGSLCYSRFGSGPFHAELGLASYLKASLTALVAP